MLNMFKKYRSDGYSKIYRIKYEESMDQQMKLIENFLLEFNGIEHTIFKDEPVLNYIKNMRLDNYNILDKINEISNGSYQIVEVFKDGVNIPIGRILIHIYSVIKELDEYDRYVENTKRDNMVVVDVSMFDFKDLLKIMIRELFKIKNVDSYNKYKFVESNKIIHSNYMSLNTFKST